MSTPVRLPDRDADRPRALGLVAVGVSALCAGLYLAHGLRGLESSAPTPPATAAADRAEPSAATAPARDLPAATSTNSVLAAEPALHDEAQAPEPAAPVETEAAPEQEEVAAAPSPASARAPSAAPPTAIEEPAELPAPPSPAPRTAPRPADVTAPVVAPALEGQAPTLKIGIVAYDRCEGLQLGSGRFPCPRDLALEQYVWRSLRALETCALAQPLRGTGEIKLDFEGNRLQSMHVNKPKGDGIAREVVSKCAGGALSAARTTLSPDHMLVRFRFELR